MDDGGAHDECCGTERDREDVCTCASAQAAVRGLNKYKRCHEMNGVVLTSHITTLTVTPRGRVAEAEKEPPPAAHHAIRSWPLPRDAAHLGWRRPSTVAPTQDCVGVFSAGLKLRRHSPPTSRSEESAWRRAPPSKPPAGGGVCGGRDGAAAAAAVTVSACRDAAIVQAALAPCTTAARTWGWGSAFG